MIDVFKRTGSSKVVTLGPLVRELNSGGEVVKIFALPDERSDLDVIRAQQQAEALTPEEERAYTAYVSQGIGDSDGYFGPLVRSSWVHGYRQDRERSQQAVIDPVGHAAEMIEAAERDYSPREHTGEPDAFTFERDLDPDLAREAYDEMQAEGDEIAREEEALSSWDLNFYR